MHTIEFFNQNCSMKFFSAFFSSQLTSILPLSRCQNSDENKMCMNSKEMNDLIVMESHCKGLNDKNKNKWNIVREFQFNSYFFVVSPSTLFLFHHLSSHHCLISHNQMKKKSAFYWQICFSWYMNCCLISQCFHFSVYFFKDDMDALLLVSLTGMSMETGIRSQICI